MTVPMQSDRSPGGGVPREYDRAHRRALTVGIGTSAALHIIVIVLYSVFITQWGPPERGLGVDSRSRSSTDMRVVQLVEIELPDLSAEPPEELPEPTAEIRLELPDAGLSGLEPVELGEPPRGRRAADVLRVRSSDTRLWREALPEAFELTEAQRMQLELAGKIEEWNDSVAVALAAEYALTDWTTDDGRWGVTPGQLHLGGITIPLPFYFGGNSWQRDQAMRRAWEDQTILDGANAQDVRSSWGDRAEAIRRRRDRDRGGNVEVADTTGGSGR
ncbi:MAG: hypothetical protein IH921_00760 [Gemmatimonadetes bacterium]|nr:hypothetical protein [Gemmatimonadota bacterium]